MFLFLAVKWTKTLVRLGSLVIFSLSTVQISLRVKDGPVRYAGRVEIYHSGIWGSLCDDDLDLNVGHVICRELGYPEAIAVPCCNAFGQGDGPFLLSDVKCKGSESSLVDCEHGEWGKTNCAHKWNDDASVVCKPSNLSVCKYNKPYYDNNNNNNNNNTFI